MSSRQLMLLDPPVMSAVVDPGADYGEVFTRRWVVEFILDLVGYKPDRDLGAMTVIEPSCGTGAFLVPIVDRLVESCRLHDRELSELWGAVRAFDLLAANAERAAKAVVERLLVAGLSERDACTLVDQWIRVDDFLLASDVGAPAQFVVGNPPYIRLENVAPDVSQAYRDAWPTMRGRSDIYVGFIERGLGLLTQGGALAFICADRWMRNQYGARLRELISRRFAVEAVVAMHDVDAFEDDVSAYPAVVVLRNGEQADAVVADTTSSFSAEQAAQLRAFAHGQESNVVGESFAAARLTHWFEGKDLWPAGSPAQLALIADLEERFPPLEDARTGTKVGIGVATGCDDVYITSDPAVVEADRLLPLIQAGDVRDGVVEWSGRYLVNPWNDSGALVDLSEYPRLKSYFEAEKERLSKRHTARKRAEAWYRTIDKVDSGLLGRPKLVMPDLKAFAHPVLDDGRFYPHHNLYVITSDAWDLEVLGGILLSDVANLFVGTYCVKMRGGCYRFQAQYIRRIRVPEVSLVSEELAADLRAAFRARDRRAATDLASALYETDPDQVRAALP